LKQREKKTDKQALLKITIFLCTTAHAKSTSVHFSFKIQHLVATISVIFLRINLPKFVQFKQHQGKSGPRRTTRYFVQSKIFHFSLL